MPPRASAAVATQAPSLIARACWDAAARGEWRATCRRCRLCRGSQVMGLSRQRAVVQRGYTVASTRSSAHDLREKAKGMTVWSAAGKETRPAYAEDRAS